MDSETQPLGQSYAVPCFSCQAPFDALAGDWCSCLTSKRTVVCPACRNCFCKASPVYKQSFWEKAPQAMWDRATADRRAIFDPPPNPTPESARRPLILVVDDEPDIQRATLMALSELGYGVVLAGDGLRSAAGEPAPGHPGHAYAETGRATCRRLEEHPRHRRDESSS